MIRSNVLLSLFLVGAGSVLAAGRPEVAESPASGLESESPEATPTSVPAGEDASPGPADAVLNLLDGLVAGDATGASRSLADQVVLLSGNGAADPMEWEGHLLVEGASWPRAMIEEAGPIDSHHRVVSTHQRGGAAVVVTVENGSNRFRRYQDERVVYQLGKVDGEWKVVAILFLDVGNPPE